MKCSIIAKTIGNNRSPDKGPFEAGKGLQYVFGNCITSNSKARIVRNLSLNEIGGRACSWNDANWQVQPKQDGKGFKFELCHRGLHCSCTPCKELPRSPDALIFIRVREQTKRTRKTKKRKKRKGEYGNRPEKYVHNGKLGKGSPNIPERPTLYLIALEKWLCRPPSFDASSLTLSPRYPKGSEA